MTGEVIEVLPGASPRLLRFLVPSAEQLAAIPAALPPELRARPPVRSIHRDLYLDTPDDALRRRGLICRLRVGTDDRRVLTLDMAPAAREVSGAGERIAAAVRSTDPAAALAEDSSPARRLRAVVDPATLVVRAALEVDRQTITACHDWLGRARVLLHCDQITLREPEVGGTLGHLCVHRLRGGGSELEVVAEALRARLALVPGAPHPREWAELRAKWVRGEPRGNGLLDSNRLHRVPDSVMVREESEFLDPELGLLAFQSRVLAMAEDRRTPLRERLRFLGIVAANVDEFWTVRMAGLREAALELTDDEAPYGLTAAEQLESVGARLDALAERQARCAAECVGALGELGVRLARWSDLSHEQRAVVRARFRDEVQPALTPYAVTLSPGHPLPHLQHLTLSVAIMLRERAGAPAQFSEITLSDALPRFLEIGRDGGGTDVVPVEEVVRGNLDLVHPSGTVEHAHLFRVTRGGGLQLDEARAADMLEAVEKAASARPHNAPVRVEVESAMPPYVRDLLLENLRREQDGAGTTPWLGHDVVRPVEGLVDLRALAALPLPEDSSLEFPPFEPVAPVPAGESFLDAVRTRDLLAHHPFDDFGATVLRFLQEAATDPDVTAMRITLYRVGDRSPVVAALLDAAARGKDVVAFVELKARFEEERNVRWARALERAGGRVVYGLVGLKTHAKTALVVRREDGRLRRYVHVGTGNYDPRTAARYTDLSLFTARDDTGTDVADLFNELTGSATAPHRLAHGSLIAPRQLLPALLERIEREGEHARAGRRARITMKLNGLSDPDVARALARASQAGVEVDLVCRGVCTLRPGVPGYSERVRVVSVVGRFLEHSRVLRFENGGDAEYFIGSPDLRPRNLRRRVELLAPVRDAACRRTLDQLLALYVDDPTGWELRPDGEYRHRGGIVGAQSVLLGHGTDVALLQGPSNAAARCP